MLNCSLKRIALRARNLQPYGHRPKLADQADKLPDQDHHAHNAFRRGRIQ